MAESSKRAPIVYWLYWFAVMIGTPILLLVLGVRIVQGKEEWRRVSERIGLGQACPFKSQSKARTLWAHAASVGEFKALEMLLAFLQEQQPDLNIIVTTITRTSAKLAKESQQSGAAWQHRYAPLDHPWVMRLFLRRWAPDYFLTMESEIWPIALAQLRTRKVRCVLVNGRMSAKSQRNWLKISNTAQWVFDHFDLIMPQDEDAFARFSPFFGDENRMKRTGNIKHDATPLYADMNLVRTLADSLSERQVIALVSSHNGEERMVLDVFKALHAKHPKSLLLIAPRHPNRGDELRILFENSGLKVAQRARGEGVAAHIDVFLWDTLGELGSVYHLLDWAIIGGSFVPRGGQNPIEPILHDCVPIHGPHIFNFRSLYQALDQEAGALLAQDAEELQLHISRNIGNRNAKQLEEHRAQGRAVLARFGGGLKRTLTHLNGVFSNLSQS